MGRRVRGGGCTARGEGVLVDLVCAGRVAEHNNKEIQARRVGDGGSTTGVGGQAWVWCAATVCRVDGALGWILMMGCGG